MPRREFRFDNALSDSPSARVDEQTIYMRKLVDFVQGGGKHHNHHQCSDWPSAYTRPLTVTVNER